MLIILIYCYINVNLVYNKMYFKKHKTIFCDLLVYVFLIHINLCDSKLFLGQPGSPGLPGKFNNNY